MKEDMASGVMQDAAPSELETLTTADGKPLKSSIRKSERRARLRAFLLVLPLLAFLVITFIVPIIAMMGRSVYNPEVVQYLPKTAEALQEWSGEGVPGEEVFASMAADMVQGREDRTLGRVAARINREFPGARSLVLGTARDVDEMSPPYKEAFIAEDDRWTTSEFWGILKRESRIITPSYYLLAVDYEYTPTGEIAPRPDIYQVYQDLFIRTAWMSVLITALCILLAYPVSYLLATLPLRYSNMLMILVLLPFWTSLLVRTSAWIVLLQQQGVINDFLVGLGIVGDDGRLRMIYNQIGTIVAMTHILLPFMILPLYSVMKTINPSYLRAARSLGANPLIAWFRVYFPLTLPGMAAGVMLVFILAIGYYITPALVGGETGIFISNLIASNMQGSSAQLRLAAALATILLVLVMIFYWLFNKLVGVERLKFG
jgi:putative spermidine/putrescine transport system permease protein